MLRRKDNRKPLAVIVNGHKLGHYYCEHGLGTWRGQCKRLATVEQELLMMPEDVGITFRWCTRHARKRGLVK